MSISLLHPSRSRITKSIETTSKWMAQKGDVLVELIVSIDEDDPQWREYLNHYSEKQIIINQNRSAIDAINNAAKVSSGDILIVLSDDTDCPANWGELIEYEMRDRKGKVLKVDDGIQDWIITMPVIHRQYYNRFGYIYHPDYQHMFCLDSESQIYMGDYSFKRIADIKVGDIVIGSERRRGKYAKKQDRDFLTRTKVTNTHKKFDDLYQIELASGKILKCTLDHLWAYYPNDGIIKYGQVEINRDLVKIFDMPGPIPDGLEFERGWLSGFYDGEGCFEVISQSPTHNPETCNRLEEILNLFGFSFSIQDVKLRQFTQRIFTIIGGRNEYIKFLNWITPVRRVSKRADKRLLSSRYGQRDRIISIKLIGKQEVFCISTETKNFIADGYLSHNCDTEFTHVAYGLKCVARCALSFPHLHYSKLRQRPDAVNLKANATWDQGKRLYIERFKRKFDLDIDPWDVRSETHLRWLKHNVK